MISSSPYHPIAPSIDRRLSAGGYAPDNVRLVCVAVNFGLGQWGDEVFLSLARAAADFEKQKATALTVSTLRDSIHEQGWIRGRSKDFQN